MASAASEEWTCTTCGGRYPGDFALCPRDATPRPEANRPQGDPLLGTVLGQTYRVTRVIAEGGMARLYEAEHLRIDARYAVKVIHQELAHHPDQLARFEREARAATRIQSDHIVRLLDVLVTADGRPCIVSELLEGEDLHVLLQRVRKLPLAEAVPIARQLCRAVADAHAAGVVHRDLKPSNVFLCRREGTPLVKVVDFGIAKLEDDEQLTRTGAVMGTIAYMAPEQARRAADAGPLADVYSIGAVLYHMLTGVPPYGDIPPVSRFALLLNEEPARPRSIEASIPEGFEAVIQHAMARDREARIATAAALESQLAAFGHAPASPQPAAMATVSLEHTAVRIARRARVARPTATAVAAGASLGVGGWLASLLATLVPPRSHGEHILMFLIAFGAAIGIAVFLGRGLHQRWSSTPAVTRYTKPIARSLLVGTVVLGSLELFAYATRALAQAEPLGPVVRLVVAGLAAGTALLLASR
jgi:serine/threonine-protein kinase